MARLSIKHNRFPATGVKDFHHKVTLVKLKSGLAPTDSPISPMISITRLFRLGIRVAAWATPRMQEWHRQRHMNRVEGQRHLDARNWTEAEKHLTLALAERRHSSKRRLDLLLGLVQAQRRQAKFVEAEQTTNTAIQLANQSHDYSLGSRALDALMDIQLDQGKYAEAEQTAREIMELQSSQSKPDNALLSKCFRKLGTALLKVERDAEAMEAFRQAATLSERAFGAEHVETANSLAELGMLFRERGEHAEAQQHLRRALQIHRGTLGPDSHEATQDLHHLAASLEDSGDIDGAVEEFERLLALRARQVGCNPLETAEAQVRLAVLYLNASRTGPAKELLMQAIGTLERKGGPALSQAMEAMARAEEQFGRPADAKQWREKALSIA
jgi:tetratricopeptide (TPR) repeat protein